MKEGLAIQPSPKSSVKNLFAFQHHWRMLSRTSRVSSFYKLFRIERLHHTSLWYRKQLRKVSLKSDKMTIKGDVKGMKTVVEPIPGYFIKRSNKETVESTIVLGLN